MDTGKIVAFQKSGNFYFQILAVENPKIHLVSILFKKKVSLDEKRLPILICT
jgi:hypothetical protein